MLHTLLWQEEKKFFMRRKMFGILCLICFLVLGYLILDTDTDLIGERYTAKEYHTVLTIVKKIPEKKRDHFFQEQEQINSKFNKLALWDLEDDWENVKAYPDYLKQIKENQEQSSWFGDEDTYEKKEKEYVKAQYRHLCDKKVAFIGGKCIEKIVQTDFCDIAFVCILFFVALGLVSMEYEDGVQSLLNSTKTGRKRIVIGKYLAGCILFVISFLMIYGVKTVIYKEAYAFFDWSSVIQSVNGYAGATFSGTIREFILLFFGIKCIAAFLLYTIFFFLACICKRSYKMLIATMCFLLCGICNELWIKDTSYLVNWKRLYPLKGIDTQYLLKRFYTVNIFGNPKAYVDTILVLEIALILLLLISAFLCYGNAESTKTQLFIRKRCIGSLYQRIKCKGLFAWELRKSWLGQAGAVLLILLLTGTFVCYRPITETLETETDVHYKSYILKEQRQALVDAKVFCQKEQKRIKEEETDIQKNGTKYARQAFSLINNDIKKKPAAKKMLQYISYLEKRPATKMVYEKGYQMLFGKNIPGGYLYLCNVIAVFVMVMLTIPLWGMEEWNGMEIVLYTTKAGRRKLQRKKKLIVVLDAFIIFFILYGSWCFNVSHTYVLENIDASIQSIQCFSMLPSWVSIRLFGIFYYALHFFYLVIVGIGTRWIQKYLHSFVLAGAISYLVFLIPYLFIR